jgi:transcriptional regulator with XRE-family HTH domain
VKGEQRQRLNVAAFYSALDSKREAEEKSWREVAREVLVNHSVFTRLSQGHKPDVDTFLSLTGWLGSAPEHFVDGPESSPPSEETVEIIARYLRADRSLKPKVRRAFEDLLRGFLGES